MDMQAQPSIPTPPNEAERLQALRAYMLLDTQAEADFDLLAELAAVLCGTPYAFIALVDADRVWFKSSIGVRVIQANRQEDYCSWAILEPEGLNIPDLTLDPRTAQLPATLSEPRYRMYSGANLVSSGGHRLGTLCVLDVLPRQLSEGQIRLLSRLAGQVVALMELRVRDAQLERALAEMSRLAHEDVLTSLFNRRALMQALEREINVARRNGSALSLLMLDLDHFKQINDRHGHPVGDAVLQSTAGLIQASLRQVDIAGRIGGEEFAVLLPGTLHEGALHVAEQLRKRLASFAFQDASGLSFQVTASFGVSTFNASLTDAGALLAAADRALYKAKQAGRNRVEG